MFSTSLTVFSITYSVCAINLHGGLQEQSDTPMVRTQSGNVYPEEDVVRSKSGRIYYLNAKPREEREMSQWMIAARDGDIPTLHRLIKEDFDLYSDESTIEQEKLHRASVFEEIAEEDKNFRGPGGMTTLMHAAQSSNNDSLMFLLNHIPSDKMTEAMQQVNNEGMTSLALAVRALHNSSNSRVSDELFKNICNLLNLLPEAVNNKDRYGFTPFQYAQAIEKQDLLELFSAFGKDVSPMTSQVAKQIHVVLAETTV